MSTLAANIQTNNGRRDELFVLSLIGAGLISILLSCVWGLFWWGKNLPNFAENILVAVATGATLKLGDTLSALVQLATGRSVENFGNQLAWSQPQPIVKPLPESVKQAAEQVADEAVAEAERINRQPDAPTREPLKFTPDEGREM